ncbi:unnamed protein product [Cunninghamella blakesleeana]
MIGSSTVRSGPNIRQPLRTPRNNNNNEAIAEETDDELNDQEIVQEIQVEVGKKMDDEKNESIQFTQEKEIDGESVILEEEGHPHHQQHHIHHPHHHRHLFSTGSIISKITTRSKAESVIAPLHDKDGKPIRTHGPETFGDIMLHPFKELDLHRRRVSLFESEKKDWKEKHKHDQENKDHHLTSDDSNSNQHSQYAPTAVDEEAPPIMSKPKVKTIIHFRHLMGEQAIRVTNEIAQQLTDPLSLTSDEVLNLYKIKDTDDLVEFFHRTKRDYSLKIHKTVNLEKRKAEIKKDIDEKKTEIEKIAHINGNSKESTFVSEKSQASIVVPLPPNSIELNKNVFLELKYIIEEPEVRLENTRRPIFALPDPDLSDEIGQETSATWVELFSDVFYVGWLSSFTHTHHMVSTDSLGEYCGWFVVMWWSWCSSALYSARYDNGDVMHHIYKIIDLCGLVGMAGASNEYLSEPRGFIYGYMVMKAVLLIQYAVVLWAACLSGSFSRVPLSAYVGINSLVIVLWGISLLYLGEEDRVKRLVLWYVSIGADVVVNMKLQRIKQVSLAASHLAERFGLFTIIILGENCISFIRMVSESHAAVNVVIAIMFGLIIIFSYFFMYFDDFCKEILSEVLVSQIWMYLHFPLHLCQVAFGMAMTDIITIYQNGWDQGDKAIHDCSIFEHESLAPPTTTHEGGSELPNAVSHLVHTGQSLMNSVMMAATSNLSHSDLTQLTEACEEIITGPYGSATVDDRRRAALEYVYKAFWISGGLILCINAFIKLVNTPVAAKWSRVICGSRILNAAIFFGLSAATFAKLNGLAMLGIMMAFLLLQSFIDLLD